MPKKMQKTMKILESIIIGIQNLILNVQLITVPPKIISTEVSSDPVVREGDNLTLSCDARGHPKPHIVWRREDSENIQVDGKKGEI